MPNYNEQSGTGQSWQRCNNVMISNPLDGTPYAVFQEEIVVQMGPNKLRQPLTSCSKLFEPTTMVDIIDPSTGNATGEQFSHYDLYVYLYSLYINTAKERDLGAINTAVPTTYPTGPDGSQ